MLESIHSPFQRTVNEWDTLSADCVHSSNIDMSKNSLDNYLVGEHGAS